MKSSTAVYVTVLFVAAAGIVAGLTIRNDAPPPRAVCGKEFVPLGPPPQPPKRMQPPAFDPAPLVVHAAPEIQAPFQNPRSLGDAGKIRKALKTTGSYDFKDEPLKNVIGVLRQKLDINVVLDFHRTLDDEPTVSLSVRDMPARQVIELILLQTEMDWIYRNRAIFISQPEIVRRLTPTEVRGYKLPFVKKPGDAETVARIAGRALATLSACRDQTIEESRTAETGPDHGLALSFIGDSLIADLRPNDHIRLANLLRMLDAASARKRHPFIALRHAPAGDTEAGIEERLNRVIPVNFADRSVQDALARIQAAIELDSLLVFGVDPDQPFVDLHLKGVTARAALDWIASGPNRWLVRHGALIVTSPEVAARISPMRTRLYNVADILASAGGASVESRRGRLADQLASVPPAYAACVEQELWNGYLVVTACERDHARIAAILRAVREAGTDWKNVAKEIRPAKSPLPPRPGQRK